jgi:hypothetical protein
MKLITTPLLKSLLATVLLAGACAGAWAEDTPSRAPVPTVNYSGVSGLGEYVAEHASDEQYALFERDKGLAVFANVFTFDKAGASVCVAQVGLTHKPPHDKASPRAPSTRAFGGASDPSFSQEKCRSVAVVRAVNNLFSDGVQVLQEDLEQTTFAGGKWAAEKLDTSMMHSNFLGMKREGSRYINELMPEWFAKAFDYRAVTIIKRFQKVEGDKGDLICWASIGLTARKPDDRQPKEPYTEYARSRTLNTSERSNADDDATCFDPLFDGLVKSNVQPDAELIKDFIDSWARVAEPGLKAPTMKAVQTAVAWQAERERKAALAREREEARSVRVAQANSCTVNCVNGACLRRWPNGRSERFQAPRKFNPFTSQWEWDTSGC